MPYSLLYQFKMAVCVVEVMFIVNVVILEVDVQDYHFWYSNQQK